MKKITVYVVVILIALCGNITYAQEQTAEELTLITYYPAPYGDYNGLSADKLAIGENVGQDQGTGVIRLSPQGAAPASAAEGDIYFDSLQEAPMFYTENQGWQAFSGGGETLWLPRSRSSFTDIYY